MFKKALILTALFITVLAYKTVLGNFTEFDLSYKIYHKHIEKTESGNSYNMLYCRNEMGTFKIDVSDATYRNHKIGDMIRYDKPFNSVELRDYATDEKTEQKVINSLSGFEKIFVGNFLIQICLVAFLIIGPMIVIISMAEHFKED